MFHRRRNEDIHIYFCIKQTFEYYVLFFFLFCLSEDLMKICRRSDPKLNECLVESIMELRPTLKKGK